MNIRLADHCGQHLSELANEDPRICVLDGDLADSDGAIHFALKHPSRFTMAGIAEQCMVSVAAGMASCGLRPWVFSFGAFLCYRAYDQVRVCLSQSCQPVTLVGSHTGGCSSRNGKTHAALNDIALMASLPNMQVWAPGDENDLKLAMGEILRGDRPAYLRLPRRPLDPLPGRPAACRWLSEPEEITLVSTGLGTHLALEARERLAQEGVSVGLLHCPQVAPLPESVLAEAARHCRLLLIVEDHYTFGGIASLIQHAGTPAKVLPIGWPINWAGQSGSDEDVLSEFGLTPDKLASTVMSRIQEFDSRAN